MQEPLNLVAEDKARTGGLSLAVGISAILHVGLMILFISLYRPISQETTSAPLMRYVELIKQDPKQFTEAPGPKTDAAPITAPYSDANRRASMPEPTGDQPTKRPGDGSMLYTPPSGGQMQQPQQQQQPQQSTPAAADPALFAVHTEANAAAASGPVNWRSVVSDVKKVASLGGGEGIDLTGAAGGEKGSADTGPVSFETQWYDWGEYAQSMVSKIRVHWYENMPQLIRTGMKGVVTIRFTIQRSGEITDIQILNSSAIPPYDFAARKALELASPLNPLPKDFPKPYERVTAMFYYNQEVPR